MQFTSSSDSISGRAEAKRGFALIITISLMAFLVLLLVTVGTFTRIETQVSGYTQKQSIAREHAKLAMETAIAELQRHAGRDDRVTNRWERFSPNFITHDNLNHPFWTAVWNPYAPGMVETTLVSGNEFFAPRNGTMVPTMTAGSPGDDRFALMVGPGTTSEFVPTVDYGVTIRNRQRFPAYVYAPRIALRVDHYPGLGMNPVSGGTNQEPSGGHIIGHSAYWVGDEGVKANLALAGDRYPYEEFRVRNNTAQTADYRQRLDSWGSPFVPQSRSDDFARTVSPTRYGFSFLNMFAEPDFEAGGAFEYFENYQPGNLNARHINPRLSAWQRVVTRGQAHGDRVNGNPQGYILNPQRGDNPYGFSKRENMNDAAGELERLFHDTTAYSRGVQATTRQNGGLKLDLTRFSQPGWSGDHRAWANTRATSRLTGGGAPGSMNPEYPLGVISATSSYAQPVVTHFHVQGSFVSNGLGQDIDLNLVVQLGLWNPFDVDLDLDSFSIELEGELQVAVGLWWEHEDEDVEDVFTSWPRSTANTADVIINLSNLPVIARTTSTRILAGETHLFSLDSTGALAQGQAGGGMSLSGGGGTFNPTAPAGGYTLSEARPTISFPDGNSVTLRVLTNAGDFEILESSFNLQGVANYDWQNPPTYATPTAWDADWGLGSTGSFYTFMNNFQDPGMQMPFAYGVDTQRRIVTGLNNTLPNLRQLNYEARGQAFYGHEIPNVKVRPDNNQRGYALVFFNESGVTIPTEYQQANQAYINQLSNDQIMVIDPASNSANNLPPSHMTFYHILRNVQQDIQALPGFGAFDWSDDWSQLSSVGQLRVRVERPSADFFDTRFFSTALLPPSANNEWPFFHNPRMRPYFDESGFTSDTLNRMRSSDEAAAHVMTEGAFNINSTSVKAWAALLNSFMGQDLLMFNPSTGVYRHNQQFPNSPLGSIYSRFTGAPGAGYIGRENIGAPSRSIWTNSLRELKPLNLQVPLNQSQDFNYWFNSLVNQPNQYRNAAVPMAEIIVDRIRSYGNPVFGTVAEFIGSGILQDAIDEVQWSADGEGTLRTGLNWYYDGNLWREIPRSSPSYLLQDDILASIASVLTARSDTFIVRAYGDAYNPVTNRVEARAWLEAIVQRVPTPINPDSSGVEPQNPASDPFGRRFEVIQFRWLEPDEV